MSKKKIKIAPTKEWTKEEIRNLLVTNDQAVLKALITLYQQQSPEERNYMQSSVDNGLGFNKVDAPVLTWKARRAIEDGGLTKKDIYFVRAFILKYSGQLARIANQAAKEVQMEWKLNEDRRCATN